MREVRTSRKAKLAIVFILLWSQVLGGITSAKTVLAESGNTSVACTWTLDIAGSYGDQISWELRDSNSNVLLSGGGYSYGFSESQTIEAIGPLTFYIETMGDWLDNVVNYHISNQNGIVVAGTLTGGLETTYDDLSCDDEPLATSEGCLEAFYGSHPVATYQPLCAGINETITTGGYAGQYTSVQVTEGIEYTFSSSEETDFITIGDEAGETVLAYGVDSVSWTADSDRIIRFYTHTDVYCNYMNVFRSRFVKCGETLTPPEEPDYDCFQGDGLASNDFENAFSILADDQWYRNVDDFVIDEGTIMTIQHIRLNIATELLPISNIYFVILADDKGVPTNEVVATTKFTVPTNQIVRGFNDIGFPVYEVSVDLTEPIVLTTGRYWLLPQANVPSGSPYWEMTSLGSNGNYVYHSENGGPWIKDERNYNAVFFIAGICDPAVGTIDLNSSNINLYPNPVVGMLSIDTNTPIRQVTIINLEGQQILVKNNLTNSQQKQLDLSSLSQGVYIIKLLFDDQQIKVMKIIKE